MNKFLSIILGAGILSFSACISDNNKKESGNESSEKEEITSYSDCRYSYPSANTEARWTAYKFTEAVGVKGIFEEVQIENTKEADAPVFVFENASFKIPVSSINSGDSSRDNKLKLYFFGNMTETEYITGKVTAIEGGFESGKVSLNMEMNKISKPLEMDYSVKGDTVILKGIMMVDNWNALPALNKLNEICKALHTGADGKSVLSSEVAIEVRSVVSKDCE